MLMFVNVCCQVLGAVMGLTEQQCIVNADGNPKFMFDSNYERDESYPPGTAGSIREYIEPFCGRWDAWREGGREIIGGRIGGE